MLCLFSWQKEVGVRTRLDWTVLESRVGSGTLCLLVRCACLVWPRRDRLCRLDRRTLKRTGSTKRTRARELRCIAARRLSASSSSSTASCNSIHMHRSSFNFVFISNQTPIALVVSFTFTFGIKRKEILRGRQMKKIEIPSMLGCIKRNCLPEHCLAQCSFCTETQARRCPHMCRLYIRKHGSE